MITIGKSEDRSWLQNVSYTVTAESKSSDIKPNASLHHDKVKKPHKHKRETPPLSALASGSLAVDDPVSGYHIDERSDPSNLSYEGLYSGDIASYKRRFECLGLSSDQSITWTDGRSKMKEKQRKTKQLRYFHGDTASQSDKEVIIPSMSVSSNSQAPEFISLKSSEGVQVIEDSSVSFTAQKYVTQCVADYNHRLLHEPHNISLWIEFIAAQDHMLEWARQVGEGLRKKHRALMERKVAIFEQAIENNPRSVELLVGHMTLLEELWEPGRVLQRWKDLVFHHPNKPRLWLGYIMFCQSQFLSFTTSTLTSLYCKSITTLISIVNGILKSHLPEPDTMASVLQLFSLYCNFLRQVGHTEKAVACYQALIEFNLCSPAQFNDVSSNERMQFFETFWDSGVPRFGEYGAQGWRNWMTSNGSSIGLLEGRSVVKPVEEENHESTLVSGNDLYKAWLLLEDYRRTHQALPWRPDETCGETEEDCTDPDRVVLFDDVSPILFQISDPSLQLKLVLSFLHFLGAPTPSPVTALSPHNSTLVESPVEVSQNISHTLDGLLSDIPSFEHTHQPLGVGDCDGSLCTLTSLSDIGNFLTSQLLDPAHLSSVTRDEQVCSFIHNVCNQSITLYPSDVTSQISIAQVWIAFSLSQLTDDFRGGLNKRSKEKTKALQKMIKSLLRLEAHRNNLSLWRCCALVEHLVGNYSEAIRVFENVLSQHPSPPLFLSLCECVMSLKSSLCSTPPPLNTTLAVHVLLCMCEGKYTLMTDAPLPSNLLRARTTIERMTASEMEPNTETVSSVLGHAYLEYLTRGLDEACKVLGSWIDTATSRMTKEQWNKADVLPFLKLVYSKQARLIVHHSMTNPVPPALLRRVLEEALHLFPSDSFFLTFFVASEEQSFISGRLRRFFNNVTLKTDTPTLWLYYVTAELARYGRLVSAGVEITEESSLGTVNRIIATLGRAVISESGQHCPLLWRLYMALMVSHFCQ